MESLLPLFTAMAATDAPTASRAKENDGITEFPSEEPSEKELTDWLNRNRPVLTKTHGALLRGETPADLVRYDRQDDLTGFTEIAAPSAAESAAEGAKRMLHNRKVKQANADNAAMAPTARAPASHTSSQRSVQRRRIDSVPRPLPDCALRGATFDKLDLKKAGPLVKTGRANLPSTCLD